MDVGLEAPRPRFVDAIEPFDDRQRCLLDKIGGLEE